MNNSKMLGLFVVGFLVVVGCGGDSAAEDDTGGGGGGWTIDGGGSGGDATADTGEGGGSDTSVVPDGDLPDTGTPSDTATPPDTGTGGGGDTGGGTGKGPDTWQPDAGPDGGTMPGPGLTEAAITSAAWYGVFRVTSAPAITGNTQEVVFNKDGTVRIGFRGAVTGKWEVFDDDSVRLYDLRNNRQGQQNQPTQWVLEAELDRQDRLEAFELFVATGPDGNPYKARYEQLETPDVQFGQIQGQWQSKKVFKNRQGARFRIGVRVEQGGKISYGVVTGGYTEYSRGDGRLITYDTGETFWFIAVPATGQPKAPLAGQVKIGADGTPTLYAPRGIEKDGKPGAEDFEAVELEEVSQFSL